MAMAIRFACPSCGRRLISKEHKAGRVSKCPGCGGIITVPYAAVETAISSPPQIAGSPSRASETAPAFDPAAAAAYSRQLRLARLQLRLKRLEAAGLPPQVPSQAKPPEERLAPADGLFTVEHDVALNFLKQHGSARPNNSENEHIFADLAAAGLAKKEGDAFIYTGNRPFAATVENTTEKSATQVVGGGQRIKPMFALCGRPLFVIYMAGVTFAFPYYSWQYAHRNGFWSWLLLGELMPAWDAALWPYHVGHYFLGER